MTRRYLLTGVALFVVVVSVATGPLTGVDVTEQRVTEFGDGTATVESVAVDTGAIRVTDGRFGTGVSYLRVPTATVAVASVTDRPRLVYRVSVPALDVELTETTVVTKPGTHRLAPDDRGMARGTADGSSYTGTLAVRVQSFTTDRTVYRENVTMEVAT
ncbi:hypothetical protein [Haloarcula nitratireducens]|uniref:Uncharacterized protein n=1 Tax=Haloarcula nitratireducens TaxID=2487749 RepID=A0AAW4PCG0_9EURY|nr:hypothetical protein [Halomicroarcula nitratireducens]MBX0295508.1 hypothetical protein [Halomicroarcula nitratireducens]